MTDDQQDSIERLLSSGQLADFIGFREGFNFEAKGAKPYDLVTGAGRFELAKDVSAFANEAGGWIIVGLMTTPSMAEATDEVTALDLVSRSAFPASQILGVLKEYVHPSVSGLHVDWVNDQTSSELGVGVIRIPQQSEDAKPFMISRVHEAGKDLKQIVFGYARRVGGDSIPHSVAQIHRSMRVGMSTTAARLTGIEDKLAALLELHSQALAVKPSNAADNEQVTRLSDRIASILGR